MSYNDRKFVDLNPSIPAMRKIVAGMEANADGTLKDPELLDLALHEAISEVGSNYAKYRNGETNFSQTDVGRMVRQGQSRIGKVESGDGNPTLRKLILHKAVLEEEMLVRGGDCEELMTGWKKIAWVGPKTTLREAVFIMRDKGYSQLPVYEFGEPPSGLKPLNQRNFLGFLNESALLREDISIADGKVGQVHLHTSDCFADPSWSFDTLREKLKGNKEAVLVVKSEAIIGIITKSNLLREEYLASPKMKSEQDCKSK